MMKSLFYSVWERTHPRQSVEDGKTRSAGAAHHVQRVGQARRERRQTLLLSEGGHPSASAPRRETQQRGRQFGQARREHETEKKKQEANPDSGERRANPTAGKRRTHLKAHRRANPTAGKRKGTEFELPGLQKGVRTIRQNPNIAGACTTERMGFDGEDGDQLIMVAFASDEHEDATRLAIWMLARQVLTSPLSAPSASVARKVLCQPRSFGKELSAMHERH